MSSDEINWTSFLAKVGTDRDWEAFLAKFPVEKTEVQKEQRASLFAGFDPNNNGYLSLAEIDKGCRDQLGLYELFEAKKPIMRAYQAAKEVAKSSNAGREDDYVERSEFRLLLIYLRDYFVIWKVFEKMDKGHDGRITMDEFMLAIPELEKTFGLEIANPEAEFAKIDANSGGQILFDEFAHWALKEILVGEDASEL